MLSPNPSRPNIGVISWRPTPASSLRGVILPTFYGFSAFQRRPSTANSQPHQPLCRTKSLDQELWFSQREFQRKTGLRHWCSMAFRRLIAEKEFSRKFRPRRGRLKNDCLEVQVKSRSDELQGMIAQAFESVTKVLRRTTMGFMTTSTTLMDFGLRFAEAAVRKALSPIGTDIAAYVKPSVLGFGLQLVGEGFEGEPGSGLKGFGGYCYRKMMVRMSQSWQNYYAHDGVAVMHGEIAEGVPGEIWVPRKLWRPNINEWPNFGWVLKVSGLWVPKSMLGTFWTWAILGIQLMDFNYLGFRVWDPGGLIQQNMLSFGICGTSESSRVVLKDDSSYSVMAEHGVFND